MLQTSVRVVESPSPLLVIVSLFSPKQDEQLIKLTSLHLDILSRCHRHSIFDYHNIRIKSISQFQEYLLRYHASVGDDTKGGAECALHKDENCFLSDPT